MERINSVLKILIVKLESKLILRIKEITQKIISIVHFNFNPLVIKITRGKMSRIVQIYIRTMKEHNNNMMILMMVESDLKKK